MIVEVKKLFGTCSLLLTTCVNESMYSSSQCTQLHWWCCTWNTSGLNTSPLTSGENSTTLMYLNEKDTKVYLKWLMIRVHVQIHKGFFKYLLNIINNDDYISVLGWVSDYVRVLDVRPHSKAFHTSSFGCLQHGATVHFFAYANSFFALISKPTNCATIV